MAIDAEREKVWTPDSDALPWRVVVAVTTGTLLNPLNSSMIAVALLELANVFGVDVGAATWLVTSFYVGGAIGMPLMGRLADTFGPRRIFLFGLGLVTLSSAVAPLAPGFGWLVGLRVVQALGSSAPYPAGLAIFRVSAQRERPPAGALGAITIASSLSAALGPVVGGGLVTAFGWSAIFLVNVPIAVVGLLLARRWLPRDRPRATTPATGRPRPSAWRALAANRQLAGIYAQFGVVNVVFYAVFFGLPLWLEVARGFAPDITGLLLLPVAGVGVVATPFAARLIDRFGPAPAMIVGSAMLLVGSLLVLLFDNTTPPAVLLAAGAVLGIPTAFNNLGLQASLYQAAPADLIGSAGGLFQTFRYVGAIVATALISVVFGMSGASDGLHQLAAIMAILSTGLVISSLASVRG